MALRNETCEMTYKTPNAEWTKKFTVTDNYNFL